MWKWSLLLIARSVWAQGVVEGTITNAVTGAGATGVTVGIQTGDGISKPIVNLSTTTGVGGTFVLRNVKEGGYRISFGSHDYMSPAPTDKIFEVFHVSAGQPVHIHVQLTPWGKIRGRVLDEE